MSVVAKQRKAFGFNSYSGEYQKYSNHLNAGRRSPSPRIARIIQISKLNLSDIARIYEHNRVTPRNTDSSSNFVGLRYPTKYTSDSVIRGVTRADLSKTIAGSENSPAYIRAIETAWKLPIERIRTIYREDRERIASGNPLSISEINQFRTEYRAHFEGITVEQLLESKSNTMKQLLGGNK